MENAEMVYELARRLDLTIKVQKEGKDRYFKFVNNKLMEIKKMEPEDALETLRTLYRGTKVLVFDDYMVYHSIPKGMNDSVVFELQVLIERNKLPLFVKKNEKNGLFTDTVVVSTSKK